jgi:hypothetical protein
MTFQTFHGVSLYSHIFTVLVFPRLSIRCAFWRMRSSGMLYRVAFVRIDVSEEPSTSIVRVIRIGELGTSLAVTSNRHPLRRNTVHTIYTVFLRSGRRLLVNANDVPDSPILNTLMMEVLGSSETSVLTRATQRKIPEDGILHSHRCENLKSYIALTGWSL